MHRFCELSYLVPFDEVELKDSMSQLNVGFLEGKLFMVYVTIWTIMLMLSVSPFTVGEVE